MAIGGRSQKTDFLKNARKSLKPDGVMILVDLALDEDEDRNAYLENYLSHAETYWAELAQDEIVAIRNHASSHDFPETLSTYRKLTIEAGFSQQVHLCQHTWHHALVLKNT